MEPTKPIFAWLNCYGSWDPEIRHPVETIGYDQYLTAFVQALIPFKKRIAKIRLSGGMRDAKGRTECQTTKPELLRRLTAAGILLETEIETDEQSLTSITIARKFSRLAVEQVEVCPILFVDEARFESCLFLVEHFGKEFSGSFDNIRKLVVPLPRLDIDPRSTKGFQEEKLAHMKERGIEDVEKVEEEQRRASV